MKIILMMMVSALTLFGCQSEVVDDYKSSVVKVQLTGGHGSGVYIGNNLILTAAHVISGATDGKVKIKTESGNVLDGEVLWFNLARDLGVVRVIDTEGLREAYLSCVIPKMDTEIYARGNPGITEFFTAWGRVSDLVPHTIGPWLNAMTIDASISGGMSGGPVFNLNGQVVGISVGIMGTHINNSSSLSGVGIMVPGSVACSLLGRTA